MTKNQKRAIANDHFNAIVEEEYVTQINTFEKPVYSALDMRDDEMSFTELVYLCSDPAVGYKGKQSYLSNDYIAPMEIKGKWFLTATHAIAYYRCKYSKDAAKYEASSPDYIENVWDVVRAMRSDLVRDNWNAIKERCYQAVLEAKFRQNVELIWRLLKEDGVFHFSEAEGGEAMAMSLTKLMINLKAEDERSIQKTGRSAFAI